jgi:hypothetical protein
MTTIFHVIGSKAALQLWLFQQRNVDEVQGEKGERPAQVRSGEKKERLPEKNEDDAGDHRIPDVAVGSVENEPPRGIPWSERSFALRRKPPE